MEFFKQLGDRVAAEWKLRDYDERFFPAIASGALADLPPHDSVTLSDVVRGAISVENLPFQVDLEAKFGDPPLTVYIGRGFRIEVLFWLYGTPAIHQHSFSGAFHVMCGSSVHSTWSFDPTERLETRLLIGDVILRNVEILRRGDTRPILAGDDMYHATFHMDRPSISVVVRTIAELDRMPQYSLLPPYIAHASQQEIPTIQRQVQLLQMLIRSKKSRTEYQDLAQHLLATKSSLAIYETLMSTCAVVEDDEDQHQLLMIAKTRHPRLVKVLERVLARESGRRRLLKLQKELTSPDLKMFAALLLSVPDGAAIVGLIQKRFPTKDTTDAILGWTHEISESGMLGFAISESWLAVLRFLLTSREIDQGDEFAATSAFYNSWLFGSLFMKDLKHSDNEISKLTLGMERHTKIPE